MNCLYIKQTRKTFIMNERMDERDLTKMQQYLVSLFIFDIYNIELSSFQ